VVDLKRLEDSIVLIKSAKENKTDVIGTGFIFYKQHNSTYLLTCAHVVEDVGGAENIRVNNMPAEVIKIGDVQGFDLAVLKVNKTFSVPSLNLMILYGEEEKKLEVKIPGYYLWGENKALRRQTIKGEMIVEVDGERAFQLIENMPEDVAVEKLEIKKGSLRSGYSGSPVVDIKTGLVVGLVTHKINVDGEGRFGRAISIEALEKIWSEIPNEVSKQIKRESKTIEVLTNINIEEKFPKKVTSRKEPEKGELFNFEVVRVDDSGSIINRSQGNARQKIEDLGNGIKLEMVYIPRGSFLMGSPETEAERYNDEGPQHKVTLQPFYMSKYPITQEQYQAIVGKNPSRFQGENRPVERVRWNDATEFCQKLSKKIGGKYRLPSESEWEYACRAGTTTPFYFGETITPELVNYNGNDVYGNGPKGKNRKETTPVGQFPPNAFGLYDMHGNVWEWCADEWHDNYNNAPIDGRVWLNGDKNQSPLRGGSWFDSPNYCRSAFRIGYDKHNACNNYTGFRVVWDGG